MDEIDDNARLSHEDQQYQRYEVLDQALSEFKVSKTLMRAREAVRYHGSPEVLKALEEAEVGWERAMDKIAERAGLTKGLDKRR
jgi:hypothetical protein